MQLTQFVSETDGFTIRVVHKDGQDWFIAKDVCDVLGIKNSRKATVNLDEDERDDVTLSDAMGRPQVTSSVNESGLYALILRSKKPRARAFRKWVTSEVLPSIRKTGGYSMAGDPAEIVRLEVEQLSKKIGAVGVPPIQAERAARAAVREKLSAMRLALTGRTGYVRMDGQGEFAMAYQSSDLLEVLSTRGSATPTSLGDEACARFGMSRATYWRMLARLKRDGRVEYGHDGTLNVSPQLQLTETLTPAETQP